MARDMTQRNGEIYLQMFGQAQVEKDLVELQEEIRSWNKVMQSSSLFNLQTINVILNTLSKLPVVCGTSIVNQAYSQYTIKICAIRNELMRRNAEMLKKNNPELYTDGGDEKKKQP